MTTIRPNLYPQTPQRGPSADAGKLAAQQAFFAAIGGTQPSAVRAPTATVSAQPAQTVTTLNIPAEKPEKILRPGSLVDIRV